MTPGRVYELARRKAEMMAAFPGVLDAVDRWCEARKIPRDRVEVWIDPTTNPPIMEFDLMSPARRTRRWISTEDVHFAKPRVSPLVDATLDGLLAECPDARDDGADRPG